MASQEGHTSTVDVLLRNGAEPNVAKNVKSSTCNYVSMTSSEQWSY